MPVDTPVEVPEVPIEVPVEGSGLTETQVDNILNSLKIITDDIESKNEQQETLEVQAKEEQQASTDYSNDVLSKLDTLNTNTLTLIDINNNINAQLHFLNTVWIPLICICILIYKFLSYFRR